MFGVPRREVEGNVDEVVRVLIADDDENLRDTLCEYLIAPIPTPLFGDRRSGCEPSWLVMTSSDHAAIVMVEFRDHSSE